MHRCLTTVLSITCLALTAASPAKAIDPIDTSELVSAVTAEKIRNHLEKLQSVAAANGNTRSLGTPGYRKSVDYVVSRLLNADLAVQIQPFVANLFEENTPPELERVAPGNEVYDVNVDFATMTYSGSDDVTAEVILARRIIIPPTPESSSVSGCRAQDFPAATTGKIALVQRGGCDFFVKARFARQAGAVGVVIFNEGNPGRRGVIAGTLGQELPIPVVGTTFVLGRNIYNRIQDGQTVQMRIKVDATTTPVNTYNVIGEMTGRSSNRTVVVGAHLDSVPAGPGINDNGTGTATLLAVAEEMHRLGIRPRNTVKFAFWGAEEEGLFGSNYYVSQLTQGQADRINANLNFDMLGSRNFVRFVYDGDGTIGPAGPAGSDQIEQVFLDFYDDRNLATEPTLFDGRSDYQAFILAGIPAGGLFSGAEEVKTPQQEEDYGGQAGRPYDACYHEACDDISNVNNVALNQLGKGAAHAILSFAQTTESIRSRDAQALAAARARAEQSEYRGPYLVR